MGIDIDMARVTNTMKGRKGQNLLSNRRTIPMLQRGRKSPDAIAAALHVTDEPPRLTAPASLASDERKLFNEIVGACDASHFRKSDLPLLTAFVQASVIAQAAAHDPDKIMVW
jgi:hypothetical protein